MKTWIMIILALSLGGSLKADSAELDQGHKLVLQRCTECHASRRIFQPLYNEVEWQMTVERMVSEQQVPLTPQEQYLVIQYLTKRLNDQNMLNRRNTLLGLQLGHPERTTQVVGQDRRAPWQKVLGYLHPALVHFPIAFVWLLVLLEVVALVRKSRQGLGLAIKWTLNGLVVLSALAVITGLLRLTEAPTGLLLWHRNGGIAVLGLSMLLKLADWVDNRWLYVLLLILIAATVSVVGHWGGEMIFGEMPAL